MFDDLALRRRTLLAALAGAAAVPILGSPARAASPKVYIDPGHGGTDSGAVGNGLQEKALTLDISLQLRSILLANWNVDVRMSRTTDITRSLAYRTDDANAWGADLFVSVHINSGGGTGFESYRYLTADAATTNLHNALHPRVIAGMRSVGSVTDRGLKSANFHVLRETTMPAVLTENLFIDTVADANLLKRADFITATARAHAQGIASYLGLGSTTPPTFSVIVDNATAGRFTASANWGARPTPASATALTTASPAPPPPATPPGSRSTSRRPGTIGSRYGTRPTRVTTAPPRTSSSPPPATRHSTWTSAPTVASGVRSAPLRSLPVTATWLR